AERATIQPQYGGQRLTLLLENGEAHLRKGGGDDRYERLAFARHRVAVELGSVGFERSESGTGARSDRSMRTRDMLAVIDSLDAQIDARRDTARSALVRLGRPYAFDDAPARDTLQLASGAPEIPPEALRMPTETGPAVDDATLDPDALPAEASVVASDSSVASGGPLLVGLSAPEALSVLTLAQDRARGVRSTAEAAASSANWERQRADRYRVEVYKKNSIALACLVFVFVGVPLGLAIPRAGVGLVATLAVVVFLFYWITLVQGEKLADRGLLPPWLGMWAANVVVGLIGAYLVAREARDPAWRDPIATLAGVVKRRKG
ncbi:MAG: LptF/LptG family permease, partial [Bacteroidota bacterium]